MIDQLWEYTVLLYQKMPTSLYVILLALLGIGAVMIVYNNGLKDYGRKIGVLFFIEYAFLLFSSTVFFRENFEEKPCYNFQPLWSYQAIMNGKESLIPENLMNIVVFLPVGLILGFLLRVKCAWIITLLVGCGISVSIESLQFFLHRGFSEVDDVMHNTLGCVIGFGIYKIFAKTTRTSNVVKGTA